MVWSFTKRAAATIGTIFSWVYAILDFVFDWIGRSTVDDDWTQLVSEKIPEWATWLFSTPSWVPALCAVALTGWLIWLSRHVPHVPPREVVKNSAQETAESSLISKDRPAQRQSYLSRRQPISEHSLMQMRQFVAGPMTAFHDSLVEIFFAAYNTRRAEWQSNDFLRLCHDLFERCVRDEWERIQAFFKADAIDKTTIRSAMMRYAQRFGESTEVMNLVAKNFDFPNPQNPNLPIWTRGRDAIASEARKIAVHPELGFMTEVGERLRQEADRLSR